MKMRGKQMNKDRGQGSVNLESRFDVRPVTPFGRDLFMTEEYDRVFRKQRLFPENELMLAVLDEAVADFRKYLVARDTKGKKRFVEAQEWILKDDPDWIFSFLNVCEVLGFAPIICAKDSSGGKARNEPRSANQPLERAGEQTEGGFLSRRDKNRTGGRRQQSNWGGAP